MHQSYNVIVTNLMFSQCYGDLFYQFGADIAASLIHYECLYCIIEDIYFMFMDLQGLICFLTHI